VQRAWRAFAASRNPIRSLACTFFDIAIDRDDEFDVFAERLQSVRTLRASSALLSRLDSRLRAAGCAPSAEAVGALLRLGRNAGRASRAPRIPPRILLCAFMVEAHPEVVLRGGGGSGGSDEGASESALRAAAAALTAALRRLLASLMSAPAAGDGARLRAFHRAWEEYALAFVEWKVGDVESLLVELLDMACALRLSVLRKIGTERCCAPEALSPDRRAIVEGHHADIEAIRERVVALAGAGGGARMAIALSDADGRVVAEEREAAAAAAAAAAARAAEAAAQGGQSGRTLSNERILHELLYDPGWRLPEAESEDDSDQEEPSSGEGAGDAAQLRRARAAARSRFWQLVAASERPLSSAQGMLQALSADIVELAAAAQAQAGGGGEEARLVERVRACLDSGVTLAGLSAEQVDAERAAAAEFAGLEPSEASASASAFAFSPASPTELAQRLQIVMRCFSSAPTSPPLSGTRPRASQKSLSFPAAR